MIMMFNCKKRFDIAVDTDRNALYETVLTNIIIIIIIAIIIVTEFLVHPLHQEHRCITESQKSAG